MGRQPKKKNLSLLHLSLAQCIMDPLATLYERSCQNGSRAYPRVWTGTIHSPSPPRIDTIARKHQIGCFVRTTNVCKHVMNVHQAHITYVASLKNAGPPPQPAPLLPCVPVYPLESEVWGVSLGHGKVMLRGQGRGGRGVLTLLLSILERDVSRITKSRRVGRPLR